MEFNKYLFCAILIVMCARIYCEVGTTTTEKYEILIAESAESADDGTISESTTTEETKRNKTLTELLKEQTDAIKKIISEHKPPDHDYPVVTRKDVDITERPKTKEEQERESIEELKRKCAIFAAKQQEDAERATTEKNRQTVLPFGPPIKPDFIRLRPQFASAPTRPQTSGNYFIFTQNPQELYGYRNNKLADKLESAASDIVNEDKVPPPNNYEPPVSDNDNTHNTSKLQLLGININTHAETTTVAPGEDKYKYVKLEPVVLQKTMMTNGQSLFYWYRTLPSTQSFVKIPDTPENESVDKVALPQSQIYHNTPIPEQYRFYVDPRTGTIIRNINPVTTTTTQAPTTQAPITAPIQPQFTYQAMPQFFLNPQTGQIYQNSPPNQLIYHNQQRPFQQPQILRIANGTVPTTTEVPTHEKVPQITVEYPPSPTENPKDKYRNEFRFIIPMSFDGEAVSKYPHQMDPYAYLPKNNRPNMMNIPVPYLPNYHMIRTLSVPRPDKMESRESLSQVSLDENDERE